VRKDLSPYGFFPCAMPCCVFGVRADYSELIKVKFKSPLSLSASSLCGYYGLFFRENLIKRTERAREIQSASLSATSRAGLKRAKAELEASALRAMCCAFAIVFSVEQTGEVFVRCIVH
jgi:hypothetical protein